MLTTRHNNTRLLEVLIIIITCDEADWADVTIQTSCEPQQSKAWLKFW